MCMETWVPYYNLPISPWYVCMNEGITRSWLKWFSHQSAGWWTTCVLLPCGCNCWPWLSSGEWLQNLFSLLFYQLWFCNISSIHIFCGDCISLFHAFHWEYYVVVSYTLVKCSLQPTPQSLEMLHCLNGNGCKTLFNGCCSGPTVVFIVGSRCAVFHW